MSTSNDPQVSDRNDPAIDDGEPAPGTAADAPIFVNGYPSNSLTWSVPFTLVNGRHNETPFRTALGTV